VLLFTVFGLQYTFNPYVISVILYEQERDPLEGPVPHLDTRLSILLSITPLAIMKIIEEEERTLNLQGILQ